MWLNVATHNETVNKPVPKLLGISYFVSGGNTQTKTTIVIHQAIGYWIYHF